MTEQQHPITPPDELINAWRAEGCHQDYCKADDYLYHKIAEWGYEQRGTDLEAELQKVRDEELEACCKWLDFNYPYVCITMLRAARRPRPPSLKEQALKSLEGLVLPDDAFTTISRALKRLQELEGEQ